MRCSLKDCPCVSLLPLLLLPSSSIGEAEDFRRNTDFLEEPAHGLCLNSFRAWTSS